MLLTIQKRTSALEIGCDVAKLLKFKIIIIIKKISLTGSLLSELRVKYDFNTEKTLDKQIFD